MPLLEVDDIRIALRTVTENKHHPDLFTFVDNTKFFDEFTQEHYVTKLVDVGSTLWPALDIIISKHITCNEPVIIEGDGIIPDMLAKRDQDKIQSLFLSDELESLRSKMHLRNRHGSEVQKIDRRSQFAHAYSEEIIAQAENHNFLTLSASPKDTLLERVLKNIN